MSNSPNWSPLAADPILMNVKELMVNRSTARIDPDLFVSLCFRDPSGHAIHQSDVHHDLQAFLSENPKALVELPRDHGKSFQVCCRVVWELGRNPGLRVKIVCATGAIAGERARFLRDTIRDNARVHFVFPELLPSLPCGKRCVR